MGHGNNKFQHRLNLSLQIINNEIFCFYHI